MSLNSKQVQNIKVIARFRPINAREKQEKSTFKVNYDLEGEQNIKFSTDNETIEKNASFSLDRVFKSETTQEEIFDFACKPLVKDVIKGFNISVLSFGQTGAGKTFTMFGTLEKEETFGIIPRTVKELFDSIKTGPSSIEYKISCSFLEIYKEKIQDLFDKEKSDLKIYESPVKGTVIGDLTEEYVSTEEELIDIIKIGNVNKQIGATRMCQDPSLSHTIFTIKVVATQDDGSFTMGQLKFVDMAGSETLTGDSSQEEEGINSSLKTLGICVDSIVDKKNDIPFEQSKLTRLLKEEMGGNSKVVMICNLTPAPTSVGNSLYTLYFGLKSKNIKCTASPVSVKNPFELMQIIGKLESHISDLQSENDEKDRFSAIEFAELQVRLEDLELKFKEDSSCYRQNVKELQSDNTTLKQQLKKLKETNEKNEDALDLLKENVESSEKQKEDIRNECKFKIDELTLEIKSLKEQLTNEEKKRVDLMKELENTKEEAKHNAIQLIEMAQHISDSEARAKTISSIESLTESNKLYRSLNAQLNERIFDLECNFEEEKRKTAIAEAELGSLEEINKREVSRLEKENKKLTQKVKKLEKEVENLEDECVDIETELNEILGELEASEGSVDELKDKLKRLEKTNFNQDEEILILKTQLRKAELLKKGSTDIDEDLEDFISDEYTIKVKKIKDTAHATESKKDKLIEKLKAELKQEKKNYSTLEKDLGKKLDRAEDDLDEEKDKTDELEGDLAELEEDTDKIKGEIKRLKKDIKALEELGEDKSEAFEKIKEDYESQIISKEKDLEQLTLQKENLKQQVVELQLEIEKGPTKQGATNQQILGRNWANDLFELRNRLEKVQDAKDKLETEANHSRQQIQSERSKLQAANKKIDLQNNRIIELQKELDDMRAVKSSSQDEKEKQRQKKQAMVDEIEQLKQALLSSEQIMQQQKRKRAVVFKPIKTSSSTNELNQVFQQRSKKDNNQ